MADFVKQRSERLDFAVDFSSRLNRGEVLDTIQTFRIVKRFEDTDLSSEFDPTNETISGDEVLFELHEASSGDQTPGLYQIRIDVLTSDSDIKTAKGPVDNLPTLEVTQQANFP